MARRLAIGKQDYARIVEGDFFYVDKTRFIKEWWECGDDVTLITRPRRFGKTLTMRMTEQFFSVRYAGRSDLFQGMEIWKEQVYQSLQGTYPVIFLSFADAKGEDYQTVRKCLCRILEDLYRSFRYLLEAPMLGEAEREFFGRVSDTMDDADAGIAIKRLSEYLYLYYKKRVVILLDEYDTPMQEAYVNGYWQQLALFMRKLFNSAFKTNPYLERAVMTGVTRVSRESIFSDLNNLEVVTVTSEKYAEVFGFTEDEVVRALEEYGLSGYMQQVRRWYDGFTFGNLANIYNPWSILGFLSRKEFAPYWANTSSNSLVGRLVREGDAAVKTDFERLLHGQALVKSIDEQIVFSQLDDDASAIWSLLLAGGYLKVEKRELDQLSDRWRYTLSFTNVEVRLMFEDLIRGWFAKENRSYNLFLKALLLDDVEVMNQYMNKISRSVFSFFDTGNKPSEESEPERFYHGFVLGLIVELSGRYVISSNRESGFGRYDVMLEPLQKNDPAALIEFKVQDACEGSLEVTAKNALKQIQEKEYASVLLAKGIAKERIRAYGFAFRGKDVRIEGAPGGDF